MMSHKIIDESHFNFHVVAKAKIIALLAKLNLPKDPRWLQNDANDPAIAALLDILKEYKALEPRESRAHVFIPIIEYAIALMVNSLFFKKRGYWWIAQILKRHKEFRYCIFYTLDEQPEPEYKTIEQEYKDWYHIDIQADLDTIPDEIKQKCIDEGIEWMKTNTKH
jgi:hypothetical protein